MVHETMDYCPDCGLRQEATSFWSKLTSSKPKRSRSSLRSQLERINDELERVEQDTVRLGEQQSRVRSRLDAARAAGRSSSALERSLQGVEAALKQRHRLRTRYRALALAIRLDRLDSEHQRSWGGADGRADIVDDLRSQRTLVYTLEPQGRDMQVARLAFGPDGWRLAAAYGDRAGATSEAFGVSIWDTAGRLAMQVHSGVRTRFMRLAFDRSGQHLAVAANASETHTHWGANPTGTVYGQPTGLRRKVLLLDLHARLPSWLPPDDLSSVAGLAFNPHSDDLIWINANGRVRVLRLPEQREVTSWSAHRDRASDLALSPAGDLLATVGRRDGIRVWNLRAPTAVAARMAHGDGGLHCVTFSPDGRFLAAGGLAHYPSGGSTVRIWNPRELSRLVASFRTKGEVWDLSFAPDGRHLAVADGNGVALLSTESWTQLEYLEGHRGGWACDFSPDGHQLCMGNGPDILVYSMESPALVRLRQDLHSLEQVLSDGELDDVAEGRRLRERAMDSAKRAMELCVMQLHLWSERAGLDTDQGAGLLAGVAEVMGEAARMHQVLASHPLTSAHAGSGPQLLASLFRAALKPIVDRLIESVEQHFNGLSEASEEDCDRRMAGLEEQRLVAQQVLGQVDYLALEVRETPAVSSIRNAVQTTLNQIPELQDLVVARQTAASLGEISPIQDSAPASELANQREALKALDEAAPAGALLTESEVAPTPVLDLLSEREDVLQAIEEEYQRLSAEVEASRDVDNLVGED